MSDHECYQQTMKTEDKETVFERMTRDDFFFACYPDISCFTRCCQELKLGLTPYDILRLTRFLQLSSQDFIDQYTYQEADELYGYPRLYLRMDQETKKCPFVSTRGCTVYHDRPGSCRLYPIGRATRKKMLPTPGVEEWYFLVREPHCRGFGEQKKWTVEEWMINQEVLEFNEYNDLWMEIITKPPRAQSEAEKEKKFQMFYLASYQLDDFKRFLFESPFLRRFDIPAKEIECLKRSKNELLRFSVKWLKFSLLGEPTLKIK